MIEDNKNWSENESEFPIYKKSTSCRSLMVFLKKKDLCSVYAAFILLRSTVVCNIHIDERSSLFFLRILFECKKIYIK